jgi:voltage-gated potassium channel
VGYGDRYPVTVAGRITAMFIMIAGVGIIGALASILASFLVGGSPAPEESENTLETSAPKVDPEVSALRREVVELRQLLEKIAVELEARS